MQSPNPIIPWIGGKRRLAKHILPLLPDHLCYVEPFAGAGAIYFRKPPAKSEVLNDINGDLVNLYRVVKHHLDEFLNQFSWTLTSRQMFEWAKTAVPETLTDIQRAARFYYLQKLAFGAKVESRTFGTTTTGSLGLNLRRIKEELSVAHLRLSQTTIEHLPWEVCVARYDRPHTLFYCDPPYWGTEGYGVDFGLGQYDRLAALAGSIKGRMLISVNDIPEMREVFGGLTMQSVNIRYTVGGNQPGKAPSSELLIHNW